MVIARALALVPLAACLSEPDPPCTPPSPIAEVSSAAEDFAPWLNKNRLEILFTAPDGHNGLFRAVRTDVTRPFGAAIQVVQSTATDDAFDPTLSTDGNTLWYIFGSGAGGGLVMHAIRDSSTRGFIDDAAIYTGTLDVVLHPTFNADATQVFFAKLNGAHGFDLYTATRSPNDADFGPPTELVGLNTDGDENGATISEDGETLYFSSPRFGDAADQAANLPHLGFATKAADFMDPTPFPYVPPIEGSEDIFGNVLPNGRTAVFSSSRPGGQGLHDIWLVCE